MLGTLGGLGDFAGELAVLPSGWMAVGSAGNAASAANGAINTFLPATDPVVASHWMLPLADNLAASSRNELFVAAGDTGLDQVGVGVYVVGTEGQLSPVKAFFLGVNAFHSSTGRPRNDQIHRLVLRE